MPFIFMVVGVFHQSAKTVSQKENGPPLPDYGNGYRFEGFIIQDPARDALTGQLTDQFGDSHLLGIEIRRDKWGKIIGISFTKLYAEQRTAYDIHYDFKVGDVDPMRFYGQYDGMLTGSDVAEITLIPIEVETDLSPMRMHEIRARLGLPTIQIATGEQQAAAPTSRDATDDDDSPKR